MKLHLDKDAFRVLLNDINNETGYRLDVLEKDYYVVLILEELSNFQINGLPAYFKGGTALYKALKTTERFSEDIDLSVDVRNCSRTQSDKRLEAATKKYNSLDRIIGEGKNNRSEIISIYRYEPVAPYDEQDILQRFGKVKIEATSFTISEPVEDLEISPLIYQLSNSHQKELLKNNFGVIPFKIKTISIERTFIDKIFASEAYFRKADNPGKAFEVAKHIYDLTILENNERIKSLLSSYERVKYLLNIRITEEKGRLDGIPNINPKDFIFFDEIAENINVKEAYDIMQRQYVFQNENKIDFNDVIKSLNRIKLALMKIQALKN